MPGGQEYPAIPSLSAFESCFLTIWELLYLNILYFFIFFISRTLDLLFNMAMHQSSTVCRPFLNIQKQLLALTAPQSESL